MNDKIIFWIFNHRCFFLIFSGFAIKPEEYPLVFFFCWPVFSSFVHSEFVKLLRIIRIIHICLFYFRNVHFKLGSAVVAIFLFKFAIIMFDAISDDV